MTRSATLVSSGRLIAPRESRAKTGDDNNVFLLLIMSPTGERRMYPALGVCI
jgi:hypothetical protein